MTRDQIIDGLTMLVQQLANTHVVDVPPGWAPSEWAYIKGLASGEILRLRDRVPRGTSPTPVGVSETL